LVRILLVDDSEPFRRVVCSILQTKAEWQVICEASDGLEAVQKAEELQPDVILLDTSLPKLNGIEVAVRIGRLLPRSKILFLSRDASAFVVRGVLQLGAHGYVLKSRAQEDVLAAVEAALEGKQFISIGLGQT
jgi:DNA-binding NarL/FixJ family response regulator